MQTFNGRDFLLTTETARELYHAHAQKMPVADYHCHLNARDIYEDVGYQNLTQLWLGEDHYKWRAMRADGVAERLITGDATPYEKFEAWAQVVPRLIGNSLYHWTHMELLRYFGIAETLSPKTCKAIWERANAALQTMSVRTILETANVRALCTTDDPTDDLAWHSLIRDDPSVKPLVLPAFRPDKAFNIGKRGFMNYIARLGQSAGIVIRNLTDVQEALARRVAYFAQHGCLTADHGLDAIVYERDASLANIALCSALSTHTVDEHAKAAYKTELLIYLAKLYKQHGFVMQLRFGVARDNNPLMLDQVGANTGYDAISGTAKCGAILCELLGALEVQDALPRTIVCSLNPADNAQITSAIGCFQGAGEKSKLQHGSAWWFNDTKRGIEEQLTNLAQSGILANFVGMLTDSHSYLSYARHEYFRRILCDLLGKWVENGEYPRDMALLGTIVEDICYNNAVRYFGFDAVAKPSS